MTDPKREHPRPATEDPTTDERNTKKAGTEQLSDDELDQIAGGSRPAPGSSDNGDGYW